MLISTGLAGLIWQVPTVLQASLPVRFAAWLIALLFAGFAVVSLFRLAAREDGK